MQSALGTDRTGWVWNWTEHPTCSVYLLRYFPASLSHLSALQVFGNVRAISGHGHGYVYGVLLASSAWWARDANHPETPSSVQVLS